MLFMGICIGSKTSYYSIFSTNSRLQLLTRSNSLYGLAVKNCKYYLLKYEIIKFATFTG